MLFFDAKQATQRSNPTWQSALLLLKGFSKQNTSCLLIHLELFVYFYTKSRKISIFFFTLQLRPKGYLCRDATNECDLPEFCTGRSGQCPSDIFKKNGNLCESNKGYCFNGNCPTLDSQCRLIWGDGTTMKLSSPVMQY